MVTSCMVTSVVVQRPFTGDGALVAEDLFDGVGDERVVGAGTRNEPTTIAVVNSTLKMKPRLRPRSRISRRATSQMLRQRLITPPP